MLLENGIRKSKTRASSFCGLAAKNEEKLMLVQAAKIDSDYL